MCACACVCVLVAVIVCARLRGGDGVCVRSPTPLTHQEKKHSPQKKKKKCTLQHQYARTWWCARVRVCIRYVDRFLLGFVGALCFVCVRVSGYEWAFLYWVRASR